MGTLVVLAAVLACAVVARFAYLEGRADGEKSGFNNGYKFARIRADLWEQYENARAN